MSWTYYVSWLYSFNSLRKHLSRNSLLFVILIFVKIKKICVFKGVGRGGSEGLSDQPFFEEFCTFLLKLIEMGQKLCCHI